MLPKAGKTSDRVKDRASKSEKPTTTSSASESEPTKRSSTPSTASPASLRLPDRKEEKYVLGFVSVSIIFRFRPSFAPFCIDFAILRYQTCSNSFLVPMP